MARAWGAVALRSPIICPSRRTDPPDARPPWPRRVATILLAAASLRPLARCGVLAGRWTGSGGLDDARAGLSTAAAGGPAGGLGAALDMLRARAPRRAPRT